MEIESNPTKKDYPRFIGLNRIFYQPILISLQPSEEFH